MHVPYNFSVSYVAGRFARSLQQQLQKDKEKAKEDYKSMYRFDDEEVLCAEIAGLCHDLGIIQSILCNYLCMYINNKA